MLVVLASREMRCLCSVYCDEMTIKPARFSPLNDLGTLTTLYNVALIIIGQHKTTAFTQSLSFSINLSTAV